jgi:hypothetical protein
MVTVQGVQCVCWDWVICLDVSCVFSMSYFYWPPVWPTYELLQVLHFNLYISVDFTLFSGIISWSWMYIVYCILYIVLLVRKAIFKVVFLNKLVTLCISGLWYILTTPTHRQHQHTVSPPHTIIHPLCLYSVPGGKVNNLRGHSIGHSKQKTLYKHVSYSERFPR